MTKLAKRIGSAVLAAGLVCGCILPASAAEAEEEARVLQYETAEPVSAVVVDAEYADVVIQPGQTDKITVESAADAWGTFSYDCTVADGVLTVNVDGVEPKEYREYTQIGPFRVLSSYMSPFYRNTVTITLPNKMYDSIQAETASGSIQLRQIQSQTAKVESKYGNIKFDQAAVVQCEGTAEYGNITGTIAGSRSSYTIAASASYGDSNLRAQIGDGIHRLVLNAEYGNIDVDFTA